MFPDILFDGLKIAPGNGRQNACVDSSTADIFRVWQIERSQPINMAGTARDQMPQR